MVSRMLVGAPLGISVATIVMAYLFVTAFQPSPISSIQDIEKDGGHALVLRDGRILEYFIHGDSKSGTVLLAIHGAQTTGNLFSLLHSWGQTKGIKIIAPSISGFGLSTFLSNYRLEDWVRDIQELLSHLEVREFHILGTSLGSIHSAALTSLYEPKSAVKNVELYVAFAPAEDGHDPLEGSILNIFGKMRRFPWVKRLLEKLIILPLMKLFLPTDGDVFRSIRTQWEGMASCADVIYQPWRFDWKNMAKDRRVIIVSGSNDTVAPPHNQKLLHEKINGSEFIEYDGDHERGLKAPDMMAKHVEMLFQ